MRRTAYLILPAALLLSSCGSGDDPVNATQSSAPVASTATSSEAPAATTAAPTTEDPLVADQGLARTLFYELSQTSRSGLQAHADFMSANNHPEFSYSPEECLTGLQNAGLTDDYAVDYVPDVAAMALDEGWALSEASGRYAGLVPSGRVYILPVTVSETDINLSGSFTSQLHMAVVDDAPYFFFGCNEG